MIKELLSKSAFPAIGLSFVQLLLLVCNGASLYAQDANAVYEKYKQAALSIQTVSYNMDQTDTLVSGDVRHITGYCLIERKDDDKQLGFVFKGKQLNKATLAWYDGEHAYNLNEDKKTYRNLDNHTIWGEPGSNMVCKEIFKPVTDFTKLSLQVTPEAYLLKLNLPDIEQYNVTNRYKILYLDKTTFQVKKVIWFQQTADKKQIFDNTLRDVVINDPAIAKQLHDTSLLKNYTFHETKPRKIEVPVASGSVAADFKLVNFAGDSVHLADYKGHIVLLDFWEVWCGACLESLPKVKALYEKYASQGLMVLGITMDKKNFTANKQQADKMQLPFPNLIANEYIKSDYNVIGIPEYVLIDETGKVILSQAGFSDAIEQAIREKLNKKDGQAIVQ